MSMSASVLNKSIRPRRRSLTRGWVMRSVFANSAWVRRLESINFWTLIIKSARTSRCSASPGANPMSRKTLPVDRVILSFIFNLSHGRTFALPFQNHCTEPISREFDFSFGSFSRPLFEGMQNVNTLLELCQVENSMLTSGVDEDFLNTGTHGGHGFPIIRFKPLLDTTQLKSSNPARVLREGSKVAAGRSELNQRLIHAAQYAGSSISCQIGLRSRWRGPLQADAARSCLIHRRSGAWWYDKP